MTRSWDDAAAAHRARARTARRRARARGSTASRGGRGEGARVPVARRRAAADRAPGRLSARRPARRRALGRDSCARTSRRSRAASPRSTCCSTASAARASRRPCAVCSASSAQSGFRLVEVRRDDLLELPALWTILRGRRERFGVVCDDLSFEEGDTSWKLLKAELDGGLEARPANAMLIATSNRRHLLDRAHLREPRGRARSRRPSAPGRDGRGEGLPLRSLRSDAAVLRLRSGDLSAHRPPARARARARRARAARPSSRARALRFALERGTRSGRTARQACIVIGQAFDGGAR